MGYLKDLYGDRPDEFIDGFIAAIDTYAIWNNGKRYIGSPEKEAKEAMIEAINEMASHPDKMLSKYGYKEE